MQHFTEEQAKEIGDRIGVDWTMYSLKEFTLGMNVELEHGTHDPETNVTHDDPIMTGKIAYAHLKEIPNYYELLEEMEKKADVN